MIEIYCSDDCDPCIEAIAWMDQNNIKYTTKGSVKSIEEYPTIVVNGVTIVGWGEAVRKLISEAI